MIKQILIILLRMYKKVLSPYLLRLFGGGCRYHPTCSEYSQKALKKYGLSKGLLMSTRRILRCNIFNKRVFFDPI